MGKRTNYYNPETKNTIWVERGKQPEGWVEIRHFKHLDELTKRISKEELFQYYIIENHDFHVTAEHFNIRPINILHSLLKWYDIKKDKKLESKIRKTTGRSHENYVLAGKKSALTQKQHWLEKSEAEKEEYRAKQKIAHSTEGFRNKISEININYRANPDNQEKLNQLDLKRSETLTTKWNDPNFKQATLNRMHTTYKLNRNNRLCRTKAEQKVYDELIKDYSDLIYDDRVDDRYPFFVDFYIPSKDLFIELNAHPSHGEKPYSGNISEGYGLHSKWLKTFIKRDPEKLDYALKNKLNYIRIYPKASLQDNLEINNNLFSEIITKIYNSL